MRICPTCLVVICLGATTWFGYRHMLAGEPAALDAAGHLIQPAAVPSDQPVGARHAPAPVDNRVISRERENPALLTLRQEVHDLRDELSALKRALARETAALHQQMAARPRPRATVVHDPPYPPETVHEQARQTHEQTMAAVEDGFFQQSVDGQWSVFASDAIFQGFLETGLPASVGADVECRASLCRVELIGEDLAEIDRWLPQLTAQVSDILPGITTTPLELAGEPSGVVIYLVRDGHELPRPVD